MTTSTQPTTQPSLTDVAPADEPTRAIERRIEFRAAPARVWKALTKPDEISRWFGNRTSFSPTVGADGWFEWDDEGRYQCRVEEVVPGRRLAWRWARNEDESIDDGPSTLVEWDVLPSANGGTLVVLRESGFVEGRQRTGNVEGWIEELADLAAAVADEPWQAGYRQTYAFRSSPDRVWRALSDPAELQAWQGFTEMTAGGVGDEVWLTFPGGMRFALRIDAMEPPSYLASSHTIEQGTSLADADEVLHDEFFIKPREDGGTDLLLFEMGYRAPNRLTENTKGWDQDLVPAIRQHLGEA